jgi:amino acid transporter
VATGVVALFSTFLSALAISTIVRLIAYLATCAALPVLRRRGGVEAPGFSLPGGVAIAAAACTLTLWLISGSSAMEARLTVVVVAVGFAVYAACTRSARTLAA